MGPGNPLESQGSWNSSGGVLVPGWEVGACVISTLGLALATLSCLLVMDPNCFAVRSLVRNADSYAEMLSRVQLFVTSCSAAHQTPLSMGFSRQEDWGGLTFLPPGDLPDPGMEPMSLAAPALAAGPVTAEPSGKPWQRCFAVSESRAHSGNWCRG